MIKLVASDLDGTILRNGAQSVDASTIEVIDKLLSAGVLFAPASGRQIVSLKRLFEPVSDRLVYISENMNSPTVKCLYQDSIQHILSLRQKSIFTG